jgi:hypothetical protein
VLGGLSSGTFDITFSKTGYQTLTMANVVVLEGQSKSLNAQMTVPGPLNIVTTGFPSAEIAVDYTATLYIGGGIYPYTYSVAYGVIPPGLHFDLATGNITGSPTTAGSYIFAIGVTDNLSTYAEREFTIQVTPQLVFVSNSLLPRATRGVSYTTSIQAVGGTQPYTFADIGSASCGIVLSSAGSFSGTPSCVGHYPKQFRVTDAIGRTDEKAFAIDMDEPLNITISRLNDGIVGSAHSQTLAASGGYGTYQWAIFDGTLPAGLSLNGTTGTISGTPNTVTSGIVVVSATDSYGRVTYKNFTYAVVNPLQILGTTLPNGLTNSSYSETIRISGGKPPFTFSATNLPTGLSINQTTGVVSGTPTIAGYNNVSLQVSDSTWPAAQVITPTIGLRIWSQLTIRTSAVLPNVKNGVSINQIVLVAGGGASPYTWALVDGSMPEGINLNAQTGVISGTPLVGGDYTFTIRVTDVNQTTADKLFYWHVSGPLSIQTEAIPDGGRNTPYRYALVASGGLKPYAWSRSNGTLPSGLQIDSATGTLYGTPTTAQTVSFTVQAADSDSPAQIATKTYEMEIHDSIYIYTKTIPNGRLEDAYATTLEVKLGTPPYSWSVTSGALPPGLTLASTQSVANITGTPTQTGVYTFTAQVCDSHTSPVCSTRQFTFEIYSRITITSTGVKSCMPNAGYSDTIVATGGKAPYTFSITQGHLPTGLYLNYGTGYISGQTSLQPGYSETFTVSVTDDGNPSATVSKEFVMHIVDPLAITTQSIPDATQDVNYTASLQGTGGVSPHRWYLQTGNLPEGITLNQTTGVISGIPQQCGAFPITIRLEDSAPVTVTATRGFVFNVACSADSSFLYATFTGAGLYKYDGSTWTQLSPYEPTAMTATGSLLYATFGNGVWQYNGSTWTQLTPYSPEAMIAAGSLLYGKYNNGIWQYNGSTWTQLTPYSPTDMIAAGSLLNGKYDNGIWQYNGSTWTQLTPYSPTAMVAGGSLLYGKYDNGIWQYNGSTWTQLTPYSPEAMIAAGSLLYGKYDNGIWMYNGSIWTQISPSNPEAMVAAGSLLYGDFGSTGIWMYNGSTWTQITPNDPASMTGN